MNRCNTNITTLACLLVLTISGCDSIPFIDNTPDYKSSGRSRPLEVPPDLTSASSSDTFSVPGSATYSSFNEGQKGQEVGVEKILPTSDSVRMERAGTQRWLIVNAPAEKIWPMIRNFWIDQGFAVRVENPETGVMETQWIDKGDLKVKESGGYLDKFQSWMDKLEGTADRVKFRTRIERGNNEGSTEIYMTHHTINAVPDNGIQTVKTRFGDIDNGYRLEGEKAPNKAYEALNEDIDAELLRRLMVKLGVEEKKSHSIIASPTQQQRATLNKEAEGSVNLVLNDQFDRSWRRVGLALDRVGFVVEDKDRSRGLYYVRYSDTDIDDTPKEKKGWMDSLKFWGDDTDKKEEPKPTPANDDKGMLDKLKFWGGDSKDKVNPEKQYRIKVESSADDKTLVTVADKDGARKRTPVANRIISLLYEQLK